MGRKAKRLKILKRIERLTAEADQPIPVVSNSEMQEKVKEQKVDVVPDTTFTPEAVEETVAEVKEMVEEVKAKPKPKPRSRPARKRATKPRSSRSKKVEE
tara:strand:- start:551 stop:850 length:300 start_codon:yes stop_codon:yes gene_type:complete